MSYLIRAGAEVAERAAALLRADITYDVTQHDPDSRLSRLDERRQLGPLMAALNMALLRYSAAAHIKGQRRRRVGRDGGRIMIHEYCGECVSGADGLEIDFVRLCPLHACAYDAMLLVHDLAGTLTRLPLDVADAKSRALDIMARLGKERLDRIGRPPNAPPNASDTLDRCAERQPPCRRCADLAIAIAWAEGRQAAQRGDT